MWAYYQRLLRHVPSLLFEGVDRLAVYVTIVLFLLAAFNRPLAQYVIATWEGFSPLWSVLPVAFLLVYGLLKVNHEHVRKLEERIGGLAVQADRGREHREIREQLGRFLAEGQVLLREVAKETTPISWDRISAWEDRTKEYLAHTLGGAYVARFTTSAGLPMIATTIQSRDHRNTWGSLQVRLARLGEIYHGTS